jgi:hypothetical protein
MAKINVARSIPMPNIESRVNRVIGLLLKLVGEHVFSHVVYLEFEAVAKPHSESSAVLAADVAHGWGDNQWHIFKGYY